jgi:predicted DsbA family dithiol-disulfide isomerase
MPPTASEGESRTNVSGQSDETPGRKTVEVYADIWCPFAHLSLQTVRKLRDRYSPEVPVVVRAWPLELVNGKPLDPDVTATHVAELRRDVAPTLFAGFRPESMPGSTLNALALVEAANDLDPWVGERLSFDLRDILFEQGQRIDEAVLIMLAVETGLNPSVLGDLGRVEARLDEGRRRGVRGSPHLFVGRAGLFCPLLDIEKDALGGLHMRQQLERLESFLFQGIGT